MKKCTKWLALLLIGAILTASMTACVTRDAEDTGAQTQANGQDADKLLTPRGLREAILREEELTVIVTSGEGSDKHEIIFTRDGDKAERSVGEDVRYYDFSQSKEYGYIPEEDRWMALDLSWRDWEAYVNEWIWAENSDDPLLEDGNYVLRDGRYLLTEEGIAAKLAQERQNLDVFDRIYGENPIIEVYVEYVNGRYNYCARLESEDGRFVIASVTTVIFGDVTIALPEVGA